jgi:ABC-2 type transport system ATP-binding protein
VLDAAGSLPTARTERHCWQLKAVRRHVCRFLHVKRHTIRNGAGKTTLVRIIAPLARPDAGRVRVFGYDVLAQPRQVRARIGLTGQYAGLDDALSGHDNLMLIGRLAGLSRGQASSRAAELTAALGLSDAAGRMVRTYSGGMRRRLDLAASLMHKRYLEEVDRFADTVHVLHHGKVIASGTPGQLKSLAGEGSSLDDAFLALTGAGADTRADGQAVA